MAESIRWTHRFMVLCLVALCLLGRDSNAQRDKVHQAEQKLKSSKSKLEELEGEIKARDDSARGLQKKEQSLVGLIHDLERKIDQSKKNLNALNTEIGELNAEISFLSRQLARLSKTLARKEAILYRRVREIYKRGRLNSFTVLAGSHSFTDFLRRIKYLTLIAEQDKRLVREVRQLQHTSAEYKRASERKLALRIRRKAELEAEQVKLEQSESRRQRLLTSVKAQRAEVLRALEERKAEAGRIKDLIAEWERRRLEAIEQARREGKAPPPATAFLDGKRGKLIWPVAGGQMIRGFGPYQDELTRTRVINNGIDIRATLGVEVVSVAAGSVMFVDWYLAYGKTVMIDHGSGMYSLYTHLGEVFVQPGDYVSEGQTIARIGSTGSLEGPLLHFEIRDGTRAVDPIQWLSRR